MTSSGACRRGKSATPTTGAQTPDRLRPHETRLAMPALLALLAPLALAAAGCANGPQPQPVVRKAAAPAAAPAATAAGPVAAPGAAAAAAAGAPAGPASTAPPTSPSLSGSENAHAVTAAKQAAADAGGGGKPVASEAGMAGAPPTGASGKATVPGKLEHPESVVVIDDGTGGTEKPKTLVEAARAEKARRAQAGRPAIVITDKSLHKYAKGSLTVAAPKKSAAVPAAAPPAHDEQFWRRGVLDIRLRLKRATEQVKELEQSASDWRRRFYAQDDPYVRDGQIKPAWDRVLDELRQAKTEIDVSRRELEDFLDQGRREGALPGWLREGVELEPPPPPKPPVSKNLEAIEPPVLKEPPMVSPPPARR